MFSKASDIRLCDQFFEKKYPSFHSSDSSFVFLIILAFSGKNKMMTIFSNYLVKLFILESKKKRRRIF